MNFVIVSTRPAKPREGRPCNGCGYCCHEEICDVGREAWPEAEAPCPGIWIERGRSWCGLVVLERHKKAEPLFQRYLGIGRGCDSEDPEVFPEDNAS